MSIAPGFAPWPALAGGVLIGSAAVLLWALLGRTAGISGITGGLVAPATDASARPRGWRWAFVAGLLLGAGMWSAWAGGAPLRSGYPLWALLASGLLVGYGTSLARGCTSGHGVCGLARGSLRSLVAVAVFLGVALASTFVARHLLGWAP